MLSTSIRRCMINKGDWRSATSLKRYIVYTITQEQIQRKCNGVNTFHVLLKTLKKQWNARVNKILTQNTQDKFTRILSKIIGI